MNTKTNNRNKSSGELQCIWMTSELVTYKLCDREFDCENCEFDKVFRNLSVKMDEENKPADNHNDLLENMIQRIEDESYNNRFIYLKNQLVLRNLFGNAFYLGINPVILLMIESVNSIQEFPGNDIKKEQSIFTLEGNWGEKDFISPINFFIIGKISITPGRFNQNRWHSVILFNDDLNKVRLSEDDWMQEKNNLVSNLRGFIKNKPDIGKSLMDGGEKINYLYQYLGSKEYLKLINGVFQ